MARIGTKLAYDLVGWLFCDDFQHCELLSSSSLYNIGNIQETLQEEDIKKKWAKATLDLSGSNKKQEV